MNYKLIKLIDSVRKLSEGKKDMEELNKKCSDFVNIRLNKIVDIAADKQIYK